MIGVVDIERAVVEALAMDKVTSDIPVRSNDSREGFSLPAFFVQIKPLLREHMSPLMKRDRYLISIRYLPHEARKAEEVSYMQDILYEVFGMTLPTEDSYAGKIIYLDINNISTSVDKHGDLTYNFEVQNITILEKVEDYELMLDFHPDINLDNDKANDKGSD